MENIYNTLDLTEKQLNTFPDFNYTEIEELLLDRNQFEALPKISGKCKI